MPKKYTGRCACGAVSYGFDTEPSFVATCHCLDCKRASGGEAATFLGVPESDFAVAGPPTTAFHYTANSGKGLDRNFCPTCGSRVYTSNLESFPDTVFIQAGTLDDPGAIAPKLEMFTMRRSPWVKPLDLPQFEAMPE